MRGRLWWRVLDGFLHGRSIGQELKTGDDDMVTRRNAAFNDVVVTDNVADLYLLLTRDSSLGAIRGEKRKKLSVDALRCENRNFQALGRAPSDARVHKFIGAKLATGIRDGGLCEDALCGIIHLRRDKINCATRDDVSRTV